MRIGKSDRCTILLFKGNKFTTSCINIRIGSLDISIEWDPKIKEEIEEDGN